MSLENIVANLELDVYNHDSGRPTIKAIALDDNTRYAAAMIRYRGEPYSVDQNATVELIVIRPDKVGVITIGSPYELPYDDPSTEEIEVIYGVYAELDRAAIAVSGELLGQFRITSGGQLLRTQIFKINNGKALDAETSDWAGEYQGHNLDEMAAAIDENTADIAAVESDVSQIKEDLQDIAEASNNLFDGNVVNLGFSSGKVASDPTYRAFYWPVSNGETYTLSRKNTTDFNRFRVGFTRVLPAVDVLVYKEDGTQFTPTSAGDSLTVQTVTVPTNHDDYAYAMVYLSNSGQTIDDSCKLMISEGSEALEWESYFDKTAVDRVARDKLAEYDGNVGIVQRNGIAETTLKLQQLNRPTRTASRTLGTTPLCLLHFSDIHGDKKRLQNIIDFANYYSDYIADVIHTGDMVKYYSTDGITFWDEVDGAENILNVIGNHDTLVGSTWIGMTMAEAYTTYFAPYISNWGVTGTSGQTYYYKDYTDNKVRLIVLDIMHQSADQLTWFTSTLASARTANLHVIVAVHSRAHWQFTSHQTAWDDKPLVPSYTAGYSDTSGSTYPENLSDDYADAVDDFMDGGGYFICWIHGHTHHRMFAQLQTHPNQLDVAVENAGIPNFAWTYVKARIDGAKSEDCFNVIGIDTESKVLRIMAVGATYDRFMRHADTIAYNYETHSIENNATLGDFDAIFTETATGNLFNKDDAITGSYINPYTGEIVEYSGVFHAFIEFEAGTYTFLAQQGVFGGNAYIIPIFDENRNIVSYTEGTHTEIDNVTSIVTVTLSSQAASAAKYFSINGTTDILNTLMVVKGTQYPTEYIPYGTYKTIEGLQISKSQIIDLDEESNPLKGKIISLNGDSIAAGAGYQGGYGKIIAEENGMTYENIAVGGGCVAYVSSNVHCISRTIANMRSDADYVILDGGGNDADSGVPLGTLSTGYTATLDDTTFAGAFEQMLKSAIARFPNKKIGYVFIHKCAYLFSSSVRDSYYDIAKAACEKWGIPYCDLNTQTPPLNYIDALKTAYTSNGDGYHPNEQGYRLFYVPKITAWMKTL